MTIGNPSDNLTTDERKTTFSRAATYYSIPGTYGGQTFWFRQEADRAAWLSVMYERDLFKQLDELERLEARKYGWSAM